MNNIDFWSLIIFIVGIFFVSFVMLLCGHFLGGRSESSNSKNLPFESGIVSVGHSRNRFFIKFYMIAMFFVIFDIESIYISVWSMSVRNLGWLGFIEIFVFIFVILISILYLIRVDALSQFKR